MLEIQRAEGLLKGHPRSPDPEYRCSEKFRATIALKLIREIQGF